MSRAMDVSARTGKAQAELWGPGARDWADLHEPNFLPLYEVVLDALEVQTGSEHLDAGCGAGLAAATAGARGANVSGFDATEALLEIARERLPEGDFRQGDLEEFPFEDDRFDTVAGFNAFQFAGNHRAGLEEARRVLKPGGLVAVAIWARREQNEAGEVFAALVQFVPPAPPGAVGPFALSDPGKLEAVVEQAGLETREVTEFPSVWSWATVDECVRSFTAVASGKRAIDAAGREAVEAALTEAVEPHRDADGTVRLANTFRYLVAVAP